MIYAMTESKYKIGGKTVSRAEAPEAVRYHLRAQLNFKWESVSWEIKKDKEILTGKVDLKEEYSLSKGGSISVEFKNGEIQKVICVGELGTDFQNEEINRVVIKFKNSIYTSAEYYDKNKTILMKEGGLNGDPFRLSKSNSKVKIWYRYGQPHIKETQNKEYEWDFRNNKWEFTRRA